MNAHWSPQELCLIPGWVVWSEKEVEELMQLRELFFFFCLVECVKIDGSENEDFC